MVVPFRCDHIGIALRLIPSLDTLRETLCEMPEERVQMLRVANEPRFAAMPLARNEPMLADKGVYWHRVRCDTGTWRSAGHGHGPMVAPLPNPGLYSLKIVCWEVHDSDAAEHARIWCAERHSQNALPPLRPDRCSTAITARR
jgi:hypothetical protein